LLRSTLILLPAFGLGCSQAKPGPCASGYVPDPQGGCTVVASGDLDTGSIQEDTGAPPTQARMHFGPVVSCTDPMAAVSYVDKAVEWGIAAPAFTLDEHTEAAAVAVADFDRDGDLDLILFYRDEPPVLHTRESTGFVSSHLDASSEVTQIGMADLDGDGRLDLLIGGFEPSVLLNTATGWQAQSFPVSSFSAPGSVTKSIHPMDIDQDGIQDAYVLMSAMDTAGSAAMDVIAWGMGDGSFLLDEAVIPPEWGHQKGFDVQWLDWDQDGWQDVFVVNELDPSAAPSDSKHQASFLLRNNMGNLELANEACRCDLSVDGMGVSLGDTNRDGRPDLYLTATAKNLLLEQQEDGSYADLGQSTGADTLDGTIRSMAWGGILVDFDNDGLLDVAVPEGDLWHAFSENPIVLDMPFNVRRQVSLGHFEEANSHGFGQMGSWRSIVAADHNQDGLLDFIVTDVEGRPMLLLSEGCTANSWLEVAAPHGSTVEIEVGGSWRVEWATTASGFGAVSESVVHFGLGEHPTVDAIRVILPDGELVSMSQAVSGRRRVTVE